jgi:hypothetical protein
LQVLLLLLLWYVSWLLGPAAACLISGFTHGLISGFTHICYTAGTSEAV